MPTTPKIHVLGLGNLGRLFAHSLANKVNPPAITLLLHRPGLLQEWQAAERKIHITTNNVPNSNGSFSVEELSVFNDASHQSESQSQENIENLIVTTKTIHTVQAIRTVKDRLGKRSTILFAQNGMGTIEEVVQSLFPDENKRPSLLAAITSHGVYSQGPFRSVHAGLANISIGHVNLSLGNAETEERGDEQSNYLLDQIINSPILAATGVAPSELLKLQLEKLVINAMINPLTVIFDCKNGELFNRPAVLGLMRFLLGEASQVLQQLCEADTLEGEDGKERFAVGRLEEKVLSIAEKTARNTSSMRQDVQAGRETEIEYINGWIVRKGREMGVLCKWNERLVELVKEGKTITVEEIGRLFPV